MSVESQDKVRIEIYFGHVDYVCLRSMFEGVQLMRAEADMAAEIVSTHELESRDAEDIFILNPAGTQFVVSGSPAWRAAERKHDDPSLFDFSLPWPPEDGVDWGSVE